ncbi:acyltransferase family protein [Sediminibacterium sp.]|jgi:peptidoglycan/LPS O-acetylase OafA/YrhL|uniref:acyltransferase family protein n=1 Tax=Sediminibacterium sp. TaxID=1917865 RepID=UPI003F6E8C7E
MPFKQSAVGYFPNLDVLRFFLAVFVVLFHVPEISKNAGLPFYNDLPFFQRGAEAVYWFFVLSGFLLSLLASKEIDGGRFNILRFFMRRVLRIWPLYFLVSVFGLLFYYFLLPLLSIPFENQADLGTAILLQLCFLSNLLHAWYDPGGILTITWSVSVEEQFYVFFPLLVYFVYGILWLKRTVIILLLIIIVYLYNFFPSIALVLEELGLYIELFLIGIIAAELFHIVVKWRDGFKNGLLFIGLLLFGLLFFTDWLLIPDQFFLWRLVNGAAASIMILALATVSKSCKIQWLVLGGKISYGIYMYHMIIITGLVFVFQQLPFRTSVIILCLNFLSILCTYLLAWGSFRFFEARFLKMKKY